MSIYDVFSGGGRPFNKEEWAAAKQEQRHAYSGQSVPLENSSSTSSRAAGKRAAGT